MPQEYRSTAEDAGKRLDQFLVTHLPEISRVRVQQLIEQQKILVNGLQAKPSFRLRGGEQIEVLGPVELPKLRAIAEEIPLDIVYEDDDIAVINKPAGMMVHAGAGATESVRNRGTLVNALLHHFATLSGVGGELRPGIVHRLDKETSGLMVVAKNDIAHRRLAEQFSRRQVKKQYIALVHGWMKEDRGTVNASISRDQVRRTRMTTRRSGGRAAITHYRVRERLTTPYGKFSLLELNIDTGRTHQIRVHLASLGHPVVGDTLYGAPRQLTAESGRRRTPTEAADSIATLPRNFLHAAALEFLHPRSGAPQAFSRTMPKDLESFLSVLRKSAR
jgi:23S rRNA pseudouridine1911/1915/1917 synthase